ncbi:MAG: hypothetical protein AAFZ63_20970 [Bacteroidota bacterium]
MGLRIAPPLGGAASGYPGRSGLTIPSPYTILAPGSCRGSRTEVSLVLGRDESRRYEIGFDQMERPAYK